MQQLGLQPQVRAVDIDETQKATENWREYVVRMACEKASAGHLHGEARVTLAADTCVIVDELVLGKPETELDAINMLTRLSARKHQVATAVAVVTATGDFFQGLNISQVHFSNLPETFIRAYTATGEPMDKAGGYAIQGKIAAYIEHLEGSYSGVMGLPLFETSQLLNKAGISVS